MIWPSGIPFCSSRRSPQTRSVRPVGRLIYRDDLGSTSLYISVVLWKPAVQGFLPFLGVPRPPRGLPEPGALPPLRQPSPPDQSARVR